MKSLALRVLLVGMVTISASSAAAQFRGPKPRGFVLEVHQGTHLIEVGSTMTSGSTFNDLSGGFFAGGKIGRVMIGGSIDFARIAVTDETGSVDVTASDTLMSFMPGVRIALLRSNDHRVELFGQADLGFGHLFVSGAEDDHTRLIYQLGTGVRLWFHPSFGLGALAGLRGEFDWHDTGVASERSVGATSIFSSLQFTGIF